MGDEVKDSAEIKAEAAKDDDKETIDILEQLVKAQDNLSETQKAIYDRLKHRETKDKGPYKGPSIRSFSLRPAPGNNSNSSNSSSTNYSSNYSSNYSRPEPRECDSRSLSPDALSLKSLSSSQNQLSCHQPDLVSSINQSIVNDA